MSISVLVITPLAPLLRSYELRWVSMPTGPEATANAFKVHQYSGFPNIAPYFVDGTHIKCHVPKYLDKPCYNRKQFHSLNAMFVVGNTIC